MSGARRLEASIAASALLHALVLGVVLRGERVTPRPPLVAIPVALVGGAHDPLLRLPAARWVGRDDGARALALRPGAPGRRARREPRHGADPLPARRRAGLEGIAAAPLQTCARTREAGR